MRADFFDQAKYPQAVFRSTQVASLSTGRCNIKGELTLHGKTAEVTLPASFQLSEEGLILSSQFILDRTRFEMDQMIDGVEKEVSINFIVGTPDRSVLKEDVDKQEPQPIPLRRCFIIGPQDSSVEFIGTHVGDDPKPRLGGFGNFKGMVLLNNAGDALESLAIDFEVASIWTEFDKLTNHLLNPDFFDSAQFPTAKFRSTQIVPNSINEGMVKGELTMLGTTGEVSFPASVKFDKDTLVLKSEFLLDRTAFGMTKMTDGVEPGVTIQFSIGKPDRHAKKTEDASGSQSSKTIPGNMQTVTIFLPNMLQY